MSFTRTCPPACRLLPLISRLQILIRTLIKETWNLQLPTFFEVIFSNLFCFQTILTSLYSFAEHVVVLNVSVFFQSDGNMAVRTEIFMNFFLPIFIKYIRFRHALEFLRIKMRNTPFRSYIVGKLVTNEFWFLIVKTKLTTPWFWGKISKTLFDKNFF